MNKDLSKIQDLKKRLQSEFSEKTKLIKELDKSNRELKPESERLKRMAVAKAKSDEAKANPMQRKRNPMKLLLSLRELSRKRIKNTWIHMNSQLGDMLFVFLRRKIIFFVILRTIISGS